MYYNIQRGGILIVIFVLVAVNSVRGALVLSPRIVGGAEVYNRCQPPYNSMVALQFNAAFSYITFCSAVMWTDRYLVTTAQCLFAMAERQGQVATANVGERDLTMRSERDEDRIPIRSFKIHRFYNRTTHANDIGLIELSRPARITSCVKPITRIETDPYACLDVDASCLVTGWGSYVESWSPSNSRLLRSARLTVYSDLITTLLSSNSTVRPSLGTLYADTVNPRQKTCFYDWGDLVSCYRNGHAIMRGLISDHNCNTNQGYPMLVTDIPYYQDWINDCTRDWANCRHLQ